MNKELLSNGILIDMLVIAPLVYFIAIRKSNVSKLTVSRIFIIGLLIAGFILNVHSNPLLQIVKVWLSPVIEGVVVFFIARKFYAANKQAKKNKAIKIDFLMHCRSVMFQVAGNEKLGNLISSEIAVLYYAFFGRKDKAIDYKIKFTSYKENGILLVLGLILSVFLIETTSMHFLIALWSIQIAWIITALSFYTCIQLCAHMKAIKARPIIIAGDSLEIHNGLAGDAIIYFENIEKFELSNKVPFGRESIKIALVKGLEPHNVIVYLKDPIQVTKVFGIKKWTNTVLFFVDKSKDFSASLNALLIKD